MEFYANNQYKRSIEKTKTLILDLREGDTIEQVANMTDGGKAFNVELTEPLKIDAVTDIYLDSFTTFKSRIHSNDSKKSGFLLNINEFNTNVVTNNNIYSNAIFIPNQRLSGPVDDAQVHSGKKFNYIGYLLPQNIHRLSGTLHNLAKDSEGMSSTTDEMRAIAEFILITRD